MQWDAFRAFLDRHADDLLDIGVDGQLAVIAFQSRHDFAFTDRMGALRNCLELARFDGFDGQRRPFSYYFEAMFGPQGPMAEWVGPTPPDDEDSDPFSRQLSAVLISLVCAPTWEARRRILAGYPELLEQGHIEGALAALREVLREQENLSEVVAALRTVVAAAHRGTLQEAVWHAPAGAFMGRSDLGMAAQLMEDEARQLALLQYAQTPAWHRRRELLNQHTDLLLASPAAGDLARIWEDIGEVAPGPYVQIARDVLDDARKRGIHSAFGQPLPPSQVLISDAVWAMGVSGGSAERIVDLRRLANFYDPGVWPTARARVGVALAEALCLQREAEARSVLIEDAVRWVRSAVIDLTDVAGRLSRAANHQLGVTYRNRVRGDQSVHIEVAIQHFERSLQAALQAAERLEAGTDAVNLSMCYLMRRMGERDDNVELAIRYARQGLVALRDADRKTQVWGRMQLAAALGQRRLRQESRSRAQAAAVYEDALRLVSAKDDPRTWGSVKVNLGSLYSALDGHAEHAFRHLTEALKANRRDVDGFAWAHNQQALAVAYARQRGEDPDGQEKAKDHFAAALEVFTSQAFPAHRRRCLVDSAGVSFRQRRWDEALEKLREAIALSEYLRDGLRTHEGRLAESADMRGAYERAAYCHIRLGRPAEGLELLDAGKTRGMRVVTGGDLPAVLSVDEIRVIADGEPVTVIPLVTSQGSCLYLLTANCEEPIEGRVVPLPNLTDSDLDVLLEGTDDRVGWLFAYRGWTLLKDRVAETGGADQDVLGAYRRAHDIWARTITDGCAELWLRLMGPLYEALTDAAVPAGTTVRILPSRGLYLLPLHAAWRMCEGRPRAFLEDYPVIYAPSMWALARSRAARDQVDATDDRILVVVDSSGALPGAETEAGHIKGVFGVDAVRSYDTTAGDLAGGAAGMRYLHFACHGRYSWGSPTASGLQLGSSRTLTVPEISLLPLEGTRLVTLASCESGISEASQVPNEYLGLAGAFLRAGAATVVSTLWAVDDPSTAQFMTAFYRYLHHQEATVADAMQRAQLDLIANPQSRHPFFWAPFVAMGAG